jgi:geranyl-CoA carboxylase alpha subunit
MIKAAAGGGGRGMRLVLNESELASSLARARSEAEQAFCSGELILERALCSPRHVEVQVFADTHGNVVHLGERDCSVQRRHQKIIEEAPSPAVDAGLRARLGAAAVEAARACGYVGAGTVEFLMDADGAFWFMEMNTRLQVEHPVTEAITGLDLVEWQLRVAAGEPLPLAQEEIDARLARGGHAMEVRLCAEDPARDFLPQAGRIALWKPADGIRIDHGLQSGQSISPFYDSMVAKVISHAPTRDEARRKLIRQLNDCALFGVPTNQDFLLECLAHPEFSAGQATTAFIDTHFPANERIAASPGWTEQAVAACLLIASSAPRNYPDELHGWSSNAAMEVELELELDGTRCSLVARPAGRAKWRISSREQACEVEIGPLAENRLTLRIGSESVNLDCTVIHARQDGVMHFRHGGRNHALRDLAYEPVRQKGSGATDGIVRAPMNGKVMVTAHAVGETIRAGQTLVVLEAMKMEHAVVAPCDGVLQALHVAVGEQVAPGKVLAEIALDASI